MTVMTADHFDNLRAANHAWHAAKSEESEAAAWRRSVVREARVAGHSLQEIADVLGITPMSVSRLERDANVRGRGGA